MVCVPRSVVQGFQLDRIWLQVMLGIDVLHQARKAGKVGPLACRYTSPTEEKRRVRSRPRSSGQRGFLVRSKPIQAWRTSLPVTACWCSLAMIRSGSWDPDVLLDSSRPASWSSDTCGPHSGPRRIPTTTPTISTSSVRASIRMRAIRSFALALAWARGFEAADGGA